MRTGLGLAGWLGAIVIGLAAAGPADALTRKPAVPGCPAGTVPVPETDNCVKKPARKRLTTICYFTSGPRKGTRVNYAGRAAAIPVGQVCNDGVASQGVSVR